MQQTRLQKQQQREQRERAKLMDHLKLTANPSSASANPASAPSYEISVEGIRFRVANNGSKLVKIPGAAPALSFLRTNSRSSTPTRRPQWPQGHAQDGSCRRRQVPSIQERQHVPSSDRQGPSVCIPSSLSAFTDRQPPRQSATIKKTNVTCRNFSNTGTPLLLPTTLLH